MTSPTAAPALNELQQRDIVNHRIGVGQTGEGGDATGDGRPAEGFQRLHMFVAGLARIDAHVDQAGDQRVATAIDGLDILLNAVDHHMGADIGDGPVAIDQNRALGVEPGSRVEQPGVAKHPAGRVDGGAHD